MNTTQLRDYINLYIKSNDNAEISGSRMNYVLGQFIDRIEEGFSSSIPAGGNSGAFMVKNSSTNYDATWTSNLVWDNANSKLNVNGQIRIKPSNLFFPIIIRNVNDSSDLLSVNFEGDLVLNNGLGKIQSQSSTLGYWSNGVVGLRSMLKARPVTLKGQTFMGWSVYQDSDNGNFNAALPVFSPSSNGNANGAYGGEFAFINDHSATSSHSLVLSYRLRSGANALTEKTAEIVFDSSTNDTPNGKYYGTSIIFKTTDAYVGGTAIPILEAMRINHKGQVLIGTASGNSSAKLQVDSTSKGVLFSRGTYAEMTAITTPANGLEFTVTDSGANWGKWMYSTHDNQWHQL